MKIKSFFCIFLFSSSLFARSFEVQKVVISAESPVAIEAGKEIAKRGGNIADVAAAVALTLSVTNPAFASFGGGGFALIQLGSKIEALDFREAAPQKTGPDFFIGKPKGA